MYKLILIERGATVSGNRYEKFEQFRVREITHAEAIIYNNLTGLGPSYDATDPAVRFAVENIWFSEISSNKAAVRTAAQEAIELTHE